LPGLAAEQRYICRKGSYPSNPEPRRGEMFD